MRATDQRADRKQRVDRLLVDKGFFPTRTQAQTAILGGKIRVGADHVVRKPNELWDRDCKFLVDNEPRFVSRGAYKLMPALDAHKPRLDGLIALDLGASTGGFTELMLERGAQLVYAVDVGYGQLHHRLRTDSRVICLEKTNARYLTAKQIPEPIDILTADLSFISLTKVLPVASRFLIDNAWIFVLIKPQFEARREEVEKGGVVKSTAVRNRVLLEIRNFATDELRWRFVDTMPSPITGPKGNQEYVGIFRA